MRGFRRPRRRFSPARRPAVLPRRITGSSAKQDREGFHPHCIFEKCEVTGGSKVINSDRTLPHASEEICPSQIRQVNSVASEL